MSRKSELLAKLTTLAMVGGVLAPQPAAAQDPFVGMVNDLAEACSVGAPIAIAGGITTEARIGMCCAVLSEVGPENMGFLQAVALGDGNDPRLGDLNPELVDVLLSCRQEAIDRLATLAVEIAPAGQTVADDLYTA